MNAIKWPSGAPKPAGPSRTNERIVLAGKLLGYALVAGLLPLLTMAVYAGAVQVFPAAVESGTIARAIDYQIAAAIDVLLGLPLLFGRVGRKPEKE